MSNGQANMDSLLANVKEIGPKRAHVHFKEMLKKWSPESDVRALQYGSFIPVVLSAVPGLGVALRILQVNRFKLWGPGKLLTSIVTTLVPTTATLVTHAYIERDLLLGLTPCSVCLETKAVSLQMLTGVMMPSLIGVMAANHQLVGQAWKPEWIKGFCVVKKDLMKCKHIIIGSAILQAVVVSLTLYLQTKEWWHVRDELEKRKAHERKRYPSSIKIINDLDVFGS